ncbi:MAG: formate--tetrahydrofolate ligase [Firmicutes bacterium]|nr:formate--tetrahydrofolate ligase [Bacillota bacterium]
MLSDIEIAYARKPRFIRDIASKLNIHENYLDFYGKHIAKIDLGLQAELQNRSNGKLIYVTAITPTPAGEGKTTTAVGLTQALGRLNRRVCLCLREPSLGPVFGMKGGATGGGYAQILPMAEINLHFTGDIHAVTAAHNLLAAVIDNHIVRGNKLQLDPKKILWRRVMDISDRQLRNIIVGLGKKTDGVVRESGFDISVASEIMAILCLTSDIEDLKARLGRMVIGYNYQNQPVRAADLKVVGAMAVLLKDALKPNLVQTMEGDPVFVHGGPFANIAHGNNSIIATRLALKLADYVITEGGFGADLGAEKFFDIVCPATGLRPDLAVLVVSARALKFHGGVPKKELSAENIEALNRGLPNLERHLDNLRRVYRLPVVVAVNRFPSDTDAELKLILDYCRAKGVGAEISEVVAKGGEGGTDLAVTLLETLERETNQFTPLYQPELTVKQKIEAVAVKIYGADGVDYSPEAEKNIKLLTEQGYSELPVCIAKTQMSLSDNPSLKGAPSGWRLSVKEVRVMAGAGFIVIIAGNILTMPGLPEIPAAEQIDLLPDGRIVGLF